MSDAPADDNRPEIRGEASFMHVAEQDHGQRLDRWLKKSVPGLPYVLAQKLMRKGAIRIDGKKATPDARLSAGQEIRIPPFRPGQTSLASFDEFEGDEDFIRSLVIHDDGDIVAINKPFGLPTQGGSKIRRHVDGLLVHLADKKERQPRLIHRLDRDTSGVLLMARKLETIAALGKSFAGRAVRKYYWAVTVPVPEEDEGMIKVPLGKGVGKMKDMMLADPENGKPALTGFKIMDRTGTAAAFVAFWPRTGRTHQIRVHAAYMGCPILGDEKYGREKARLEGFDVSRRLHLHASRLILPHPSGKGQIDLYAPLPKDMSATWGVLGFQNPGKADPFSDADV